MVGYSVNIGVIYKEGSGRVLKPIMRLTKAIEKLGHKSWYIEIDRIASFVGYGEKSGVWYRDDQISKILDGAFLRTFGAGSCEALSYRISAMEHLEFCGVRLMNRTYAMRQAKDKYATLFYLEKAGLPIPKTVISGHLESAYNEFKNLQKAVIKPLIGSRGLGVSKVVNETVAYYIMKNVTRLNEIIYLQELLELPGEDFRLFVIGNRVIAAMKRRASKGEWKTNISQGGKPIKFIPPADMEDLAVRAVKALKLDYAGIDIAVIDEECKILEVNAAPAWEGLQTTTNVNIALELVKYLINEIKK